MGLTASAVWAGATPCFWALVRPKPSRLRLGSLPPTLRNSDINDEPLVDANVDADIDIDAVRERDGDDEVVVEHFAGGTMRLIDAFDPSPSDPAAPDITVSSSRQFGASNLDGRAALKLLD